MFPEVQLGFPGPFPPLIIPTNAEVAAAGLKALWESTFPDEAPCTIFRANGVPEDTHMVTHQPFLLNALISQRTPLVHGWVLSSTTRIDPSASPHTRVLAATPFSTQVDTQLPIPLQLSSPTGWRKHTFSRTVRLDDESGAKKHEEMHMFSVLFESTQYKWMPGDCVVALREGQQEVWFALQSALRDLWDATESEYRKGQVLVLGGAQESQEMRKTLLAIDDEQLVLPNFVSEQLLMQQCIFVPAILAQYEKLKQPRLRQVLLFGQPGTGKTTAMKWLAARHLRAGGFVIYLCPCPGEDTYGLLVEALEIAAKTALPTIVVAEDFEKMLDSKRMQAFLNLLDGVLTPDNPAGTLLLASSNDPRAIEGRIRKRHGRINAHILIPPAEDKEVIRQLLFRYFPGYQDEVHAAIISQLQGLPGSSIKEVCQTAAFIVVRDQRERISLEDMQAALRLLREGLASMDADFSDMEPSRPWFRRFLQWWRN